MKIDVKTAAAAVALLVLGLSLGRRNAEVAAGLANSPVKPMNAATPAHGMSEWWTYAGSW